MTSENSTIDNYTNNTSQSNNQEYKNISMN
jgi:hypothetical protein